MQLVKHLLLLVLSYNSKKLNCPNEYERDASNSHPFLVPFNIDNIFFYLFSTAIVFAVIFSYHSLQLEICILCRFITK